MGGVWSGWKDRQRSSVRGERGGKDEKKKGIERQKTQIDMAGGMQRQIVCGGMCINESAGLHLVGAPLKETEGQKK